MCCKLLRMEAVLYTIYQMWLPLSYIILLVLYSSLGMTTSFPTQNMVSWQRLIINAIVTSAFTFECFITCHVVLPMLYIFYTLAEHLWIHDYVSKQHSFSETSFSFRQCVFACTLLTTQPGKSTEEFKDKEGQQNSIKKTACITMPE